MTNENMKKNVKISEEDLNKVSGGTLISFNTVYSTNNMVTCSNMQNPVPSPGSSTPSDSKRETEPKVPAK